ncbi:sugar ABC transporter permease [Oscillospiraceae bacterium PP1C4]
MKKKKIILTPYYFLLPSLLIFSMFVFYPFFKTVAYSFTLTNARGIPVEFVGLDNYIGLFTSKNFINSLLLTLKFAPMVGIPTVILGFILAVLASNRSKGRRFYEVAFALPMAVASAPAAALWVMLLSPNQNGIINYLLNTEIAWLFDKQYALIAVAFVTIWMNIGVSFIFLLTGLKNVPEELLESATIDGAGYFTKLFRISVPVASPQIFFVIFFNIATSFQAFAQIRLLTEGGPSYSTNVLVYSIYQSALRDGRFETAFAQSIILFIIILCITLIQFKFEDRTVQY